MSEKKFEYILKQACDKKVKVSIASIGAQAYYHGYIMDIGEDYVRLRKSREKEGTDYYIRIAIIEAVMSEWKK